MAEHIAIVFESIYHFSKGGAEKRLFEIAKGLVAKGYKVSWFGFNYWQGDSPLIVDGINLYGVMPYQSMRGTNGGRRGVLGVLKYCFALFRYKFPNDVDFILAGQAPLVHILVLKLKTMFRPVPIIVDCWEVWHDHWLDYYGSFKGRAGILVEKLVFSAADHLIAISDHTVKELALYDIPKEKISLAHNGVSYERILSLKPSEIRSDIIYFGRLVKHKNVDVLIKAVDILRRRFPDIKVFILGGGPEEVRLKKLANDLGLTDTIKFWGVIENHDDALRLLKASKISIIPSTSEGGGCIALFEANACGLPVIAVRHEQGIDFNLIIDGVNGYWVQNLSETLIAGKAVELLANPQLLEKMKSLSTEQMKKHDWVSIVKVYDNLFLHYSMRKC